LVLMAQQIAVTSRVLPVYPNGIQDALTVQNTGSNPVYLDQGPTVSTNSLVVNAGGTQTWPGGTALWMVSPLGTTVTVTDGAGATFDPLAIATAIEQFLTPAAIVAASTPQALMVRGGTGGSSGTLIPATASKQAKLWSIAAVLGAPSSGSNSTLTIQSNGVDVFPGISVPTGSPPIAITVPYSGYVVPNTNTAVLYSVSSNASSFAIAALYSLV
jgi:hypothetical protein